MKWLMLFIISIFFCLMITGCTKNTTTIQNNQFYQTDYDYMCFENDKTWSEIVICLNAESQAEKAQNKITNDLLD